MTPIDSLIKILADCAQQLGMGQHSYIVGGAPRDYWMGLPVKDVDVVVEPQAGKTAATLGDAVALALGGLRCHPDQYGVCHIGPVPTDIAPHGVSLKGQKVEIVSSRKEKYDRSRSKESHKPVEVATGTIFEDLERRDFTINTLVWRLGDLVEGVEKAPVRDILGKGLEDLEDRILRTPLDPKETFDDDPSRMLRAVRFAVKYRLEIDPAVREAICEKAGELRRLPYEAIDPLFFDKILTMDLDRLPLAIAMIGNMGLQQPIIDLIPRSRMRRAIKERISNTYTLLWLAQRGYDIGVKFTGNQYDKLWQAAQALNPADGQELDQLFDRFLRRPCDTEAYMAATGAQGPAIGRAVERARDLVLDGLSPEEVQAILIREYTP